jgi:predicted nucleic acid-binding protein
MKRVFADTSFFVAAIGPRDQFHEQAVEFMRAYDGQVLTTDFVLVEFGNYLFRIKDRPFLEPVLHNIRTNPQYEIVPASRELLQRGIDRFIARTDKEWSLTDCISFVVMEGRGVTEALTSDADFGQAGFAALLT